MNDAGQNAEERLGEERLPVTILTGFLGSGKTTLLRQLLTSPHLSNAAVIINEFGDVGLDHLLVEKVDEDLMVMDSGCVCCTIRDDLIVTLRSLFKRRYKGEVLAFDRIVLETTGLADPAPIIHTLMTDPVVANRFKLDGVVTCVDALNGMHQLDKQQESVKQSAVADRLVLTKCDMLEGDEGQTALTALRRRLRKNNPAATILEGQNGQVDETQLFNVGLYNPETKSTDVQRWLKEEAYEEADGHSHSHGHGHGHGHAHGHSHGHGSDCEDEACDHPSHDRHDDRIRSFCIRDEGAVDWDIFVEWIEALIATNGGDLLRMKGIIKVKDAEGPVAVHGVHHVFHPPAMLQGWNDEEEVSRIVFITRGIEKEAVEQMYHAFVHPN